MGTLRTDGDYIFYRIQHHWPKGNGWTDSAIDSFLFRGLSFKEKNGEKGDAYRALLDPQGAGSDLWQTTGIHGYVDLPDAQACLKAIRKENKGSGIRFRIVRYTISQSTEVVK